MSDRPTTYPVTGMTCGGCAARVTRAVQDLPGVTRAEVDLGAGRLLVEGAASDDEVAAAVGRAGYGIG